MSIKPITFSAPMVRALLAGTKTQTRRLVSKPEHYGCPTGDCPHSFQHKCNAAMSALVDEIARYKVGDRLYVREAWKTSAIYDRTSPRDLAPGSPIYFVADDRLWSVARYRQAMHMLRWASRIWLEVTEVRVQRLQDISEADCIAEGPKVKGWADFGALNTLNGIMVETDQPHVSATPRCWYRELWDSLHTEPGTRWEDNPWIVAVSFTIHHGNIDQQEPA